ncbi:hypothetical protein [Clostridium sp. KNHs214]|uniref:hypothetical protein n=1 Tax=Clostridium sp. KNHs214 TaxID=1540257 RepID=UPI000554FD55|nr:hypothetical protein [Clostridium sp. KNHs214]
MSRKKVLYIGTPIFNYHKKIISEFEAKGYSVDFYNDRPSENSFIKGMIKIKKSLLNSLIQKYFDKIMSETKDKTYDLVFIVNCKVFTSEMIKQLRESQKSARFVLYMWDSLTLYPDSRKLIPLFDTAYSFDLDDCEKIEKLKFLPLFYCKEFEQVGQVQDSQIDYDIVSVCTAHPNRYKTMHKLFPELESKGIRIFSYMFLNKLQYLYNITFVPEFKGSKRSEFKFIPLSESENLDVLKRANSVFDMQHNKQSGLTMRTIETLGAKRKLITTNRNIKRYEFYNENNIFVMDENNLDKIEAFIKRKYEPINDEVYKKYSISSWIDTIINDNKYLK